MPTSIHDSIITFIRHPEPERFNKLALQVFRFQFDHVTPYRRYCLNQGATPVSVVSVESIPAVSTIAFKYAEFSIGQPERVFVTSGTSVGKSQQGRHFIPCLEVYRTSALEHLARMLFPDRVRLRMLALHPTAEAMPHSSLAQMISWCIDEFGIGKNLFAADGGVVDVAAAIDFLAETAQAGSPVCILTTTAALGLLFETLRDRAEAIILPARSRLMDTGGAKGQKSPLSTSAVINQATKLLGIAPEMAVNEYGMTELCSQLYDATPFNSQRHDLPGRRVKIAPPWLQPTAVDPVTLEPLPDGEAGMLRYFDLANVGSVSALLTEDLGAVEGGMVTILGRTEAADARGCALSLAQFAQTTDPPIA